MYQSLDFGIFIVFGFFIISGFIRGFVWEVTKMLSVSSSLFLSLFSGYKLCKISNKWDKWLKIVLFVGLPIIVFLLIGYMLLSISAKLSSIVKKSHFKTLDRFLGLIFGFVKAFLLTVMLLIIVVNIYPDFTFQIQGSKVYNFVFSDHVIIIHTKKFLSDVYVCLNRNLEYLFNCLSNS